ncbi:unnamed protein product, partial [marine sediment metagenome]
MKEVLQKCREEDIPMLFELFKTVYRFNPRLKERDYFDWQFKDNPFNNHKDYTFWIMWEENTIKGFISYIPI